MAWPAHAIFDVGLLFVETANEPVTLSTPAGFELLHEGGVGTAGATDATRTTVFWCRANTTSMATPVIADAGDHVAAILFCIRGAQKFGTPVVVLGSGTLGVASTAVSIPGGTTTEDNTLVIPTASFSLDMGNIAVFTPGSSPGLTSYTEILDGCRAEGNGGGHAILTGTKATPGAFAASTGTVSIASLQAYCTLGVLADAQDIDASHLGLEDFGGSVGREVSVGASLIAQESIVADVQTVRYRMRARDTTLNRTVYWFSEVIDGEGNDYEGPGPLTDIVVSELTGLPGISQ